MLISARIFARGLFLIALLLVCLANAAGHTHKAQKARQQKCGLIQSLVSILAQAHGGMAKRRQARS
jgi:hypothetical protein